MSVTRPVFWLSRCRFIFLDAFWPGFWLAYTARTGLWLVRRPFMYPPRGWARLLVRPASFILLPAARACLWFYRQLFRYPPAVGPGFWPTWCRFVTRDWCWPSPLTGPHAERHCCVPKSWDAAISSKRAFFSIPHFWGVKQMKGHVPGPPCMLHACFVSKRGFVTMGAGVFLVHHVCCLRAFVSKRWCVSGVRPGS